MGLHASPRPPSAASGISGGWLILQPLCDAHGCRSRSSQQGEHNRIPNKGSSSRSSTTTTPNAGGTRSGPALLAGNTPRHHDPLRPPCSVSRPASCRPSRP